MFLKCECDFDRFVVCEEFLDKLHSLTVDIDDASYEVFHKDDPEGNFYSDLAKALYSLEDSVIKHFKELKLKASIEEDEQRRLFDEDEKEDTLYDAV